MTSDFVTNSDTFIVKKKMQINFFPRIFHAVGIWKDLSNSNIKKKNSSYNPCKHNGVKRHLHFSDFWPKLKIGTFCKFVIYMISRSISLVFLQSVKVTTVGVPTGWGTYHYMSIFPSIHPSVHPVHHMIIIFSMHL